MSLDHLACHAWIVGDGIKKPMGAVAVPRGVAPHTQAALSVPTFDIFSIDGEAYLQLEFSLKESTLWAQRGHIVASSQVQLRVPSATTCVPISKATSPPTVEKLKSTLVISAGASTWTISRTQGRLTSWIKAGKELFQPGKALELGVYRATTDNDNRKDAVEWKEKFVHLSREESRYVSLESNSEDSSVVLTIHSRVAPPSMSWGITEKTTYTFLPDGCLHFECCGLTRPLISHPTSHGLASASASPLRLSASSGLAEGGESYKDKKNSQLFGNWSSTVDNLFTEYEHPQESASRTDVRWVKFLSSFEGGAMALKASFGAQDGFSFAATHYTPEDTDSSKYPFQLHSKKNRLRCCPPGCRSSRPRHRCLRAQDAG